MASQTKEGTESPTLSRIPTNERSQVSTGHNPSAAAGGHTGALIGHLESALTLGKGQTTGHGPADEPDEAGKLGPSPTKVSAAKEAEEFHSSPIEKEHKSLPSSASAEGACPRISFGGGAPHPRWVFVEARISQNASSPAGRAAVKAIQPPPQPGAAAIGTGSSESSGMGILAWLFEPGPEETWDGLTPDRLYVHAYKALEVALDDPITRERLRDAIRSSKVAPKVSRVEDPLPPLPLAPNMGYGVSQSPVAFDAGYNYLSYARPSLARRKNDNDKYPPSDLLAKIRAHAWGDCLSPGPDLDFTGVGEISGGGPFSNDENGSRKAGETTQASRSSVQWLDGTGPAPIGGIELADVSPTTWDEALSYSNREEAATGNGAAAEESTSPASTMKVQRRGSLKTATGLKRKREGDAGPRKEGASGKNPQPTVTPPGKEGPKWPAGQHQQQSRGREHSETFVPAIRAPGKSRKKAAESADTPPRRNPPRKAKKTQYSGQP